MKLPLALLWLCTLFMGCQKTESDMDRLIGVWVEISDGKDDESGISFFSELLSAPKLEILSETKCQLTFFGIPGLGEMKVNEMDKIIDLKWKGKDMQFVYDLDKTETITLLGGKGKYIFKRANEPTSIAINSITNITLTESDLLGTWELRVISGGGAEMVKNFMGKESSAMYHFKSENKLQIRYRNGAIRNGVYYLKDGNTLLLGMGEDLEKYEFELFSKEEIRLLNVESRARITLQVPQALGSKEYQESEPIVSNSPPVIKKRRSFFQQNNYPAKFQALRKELQDNYDLYVSIMMSRKTGNMKAFKVIQEDWDYIRKSNTLNVFIQDCPRIDKDIVKEYFNGMELFLNTIREEVK